MIKGYQIFLGTVQPSRISFLGNSKSTIFLFEMQKAVRQRKLLAIISAGIRSVSASPFQGFRILGAQFKRKFGRREAEELGAKGTQPFKARVRF